MVNAPFKSFEFSHAGIWPARWFTTRLENGFWLGYLFYLEAAMFYVPSVVRAGHALCDDTEGFRADCDEHTRRKVIPVQIPLSLSQLSR